MISLNGNFVKYNCKRVEHYHIFLVCLTQFSLCDIPKLTRLNGIAIFKGDKCPFWGEWHGISFLFCDRNSPSKFFSLFSLFFNNNLNFFQKSLSNFLVLLKNCNKYALHMIYFGNSSYNGVQPLTHSPLLTCIFSNF